MKGKTDAYLIWAPAILALLVVGLLPTLTSGIATDDAVTLDTAVTVTPTLTVTAAPATAVTVIPATVPTVTPIIATTATTFDEQQAVYALEARVIEIYDNASPSVVNITSRTYLTYGFMGTVPEEGTGSGFIYDTEGHIVTNYHQRSQ
jgi:S1-C subfamily serine protease